MELEKVDAVRFQHAETVFDVRGAAGAVARLTLRREHDPVAHVRERETDLLLAVGVGVGGVEEADAALERGADEPRAVLPRAALYGQAAHGGLGDLEPGFAEHDFFHDVSPSKGRRAAGYFALLSG